jgi:hypothetical protein
MFAALGEETGFCEWVKRLGGEATLAAPTRRGGWAGATLLYLRASLLHGGAGQASVRTTVTAARRDGALLTLELDEASWIRDRGGPQTAYELAALRPDILFATEASAAELGVPLEGIASVPVTRLESGGCMVHGRRVLGSGSGHDRDALAAAFCVALLEGVAPVEAAGRAVLVAAR